MMVGVTGCRTRDAESQRERTRATGACTRLLLCRAIKLEVRRKVRFGDPGFRRAR